MENCYALFVSDQWNRNPHFIGVFSEEKLLNGVHQYVYLKWIDYRQGEETQFETAERVVQEFCENNLQTQGYSTNLQAEEIEVNELYD